MKKPSASKPKVGLKTKGLAKGLLKTKGLAKGFKEGIEKVLIDTSTVSMGGGKNQRYLQHQPGPDGAKRLIAAVTLNQASKTTKSHQQLIELLLPAPKTPGATKAQVLAEREARSKVCKIGLAKGLLETPHCKWEKAVGGQLLGHGA